MLNLYNTLTRSIEPFKPRDPNNVTMYSCGPTVYDYQHIGHMRRYVGDDILVRVLEINGYNVKRVMNITDVGHLVSDSNEGEDKMEKGARKFNKSVWEIAKMFEEQFIDSCNALLIKKPALLMHATNYIKEQIGLIHSLKERGFTYETLDGIYFNTANFPSYFKLSREKSEGLKAGARIEMIDDKKNISDFALWKFDNFGRESEEFPKRQMNWWFEGSYRGQLVTKESWKEAGIDEKTTLGFPGWHIECSVMSLAGLFDAFAEGRLVQEKVKTIDMHTGGIDHIAIHHTNEIAQSEAATDKKFVNYWVHHNFLQVNGEKMSKSLGNFYTVQDVVAKGFDPLALRYLYLQTHYRQEMNFTWESLESAEKGLQRLRGEISNFKFQISNKKTENDYTNLFLQAVNLDMNMAAALACVWEVLKSDYSDIEKATSIRWMDTVLGLEMFKKQEAGEIPERVLRLGKQREEFRKQKNYQKSDELREEIKHLGYEVKDTKEGQIIQSLEF